MQYFVVFTPKKRFESSGKPSDFQEMGLKEQAQAQSLYANGGLLQMWALDTEDQGAAVLFEAESSGKLQEMIDSFPFVQADYVDYTIFPLVPYPEFGKQA